jgi:2,3-bisphosphoglycerate-independent phosphoglycerate mutase
MPLISDAPDIRLKLEPDNDTLFFFNYRSDRMREIVTVLGLPDPPMEVEIPKDLVSFSPDCDPGINFDQ